MKKNYKSIIILLIFALLFYGVFFALIELGYLNQYYSQILILIGINIILALSLNLILGFTGQLALGHAGFMSIGGYTAAMITLKLNLPFIAAILAAGIAAGLTAFLIGIPILRLNGDYLAITTLAFGEIIKVIIFNVPVLGGPQGLPGITKKTNFTWVFFIVLAAVIVIRNIVRSSQGRAMISVREDEIAAQAMGINTFKYKILAFSIGSGMAGVAGALYAHYFMYLDPTSFNFLKSFDILIFVVFGGIGSLTGTILSTSILTILPEALRAVSDYRLVIYAVLLIAIMRFRPEGLLGTKEITDYFHFGKKTKNKDKILKGGGEA